MENKRKRAVAYCRVSTDHKDQANSFQAQQRYFKGLFSENDDIDLIEIFADKGLSGTKLYRPQLDLMLQNAGLQRIVDKDTDEPVDTYKIVGKSQFDYIYVSNISRFARNISADNLIKTLGKNNVYLVYVDFQSNIYSTETSQGEKFIIDELVHAERFSRDLSAKVKFGMRQGAKNGNIFGGANLFGYDYVPRNLNEPEKGNYLVINEHEAEIVRLIFHLYVDEKMGTERIARYLGERGYFTRKERRFTSATILNMIKNEKYCGINNAMQFDTGSVFGNRTKHIVEYENPIRQQSRIATEQLKAQGFEKIPAIITPEVWHQAQEIKKSRSTNQVKNRGRYAGKTDYSGLIKCSKCGCSYISGSVKRLANGSTERYYACAHRHRFDTEHGIPQCTNPTIAQSKLDSLLNSNAYCTRRWFRIRKLIQKAKLCKQELESNIDADNEDTIIILQQQLTDIKTQKDRLLNLYIKGKISEEQYDSNVTPLNDEEQKTNLSILRLSQDNDELKKAIHKMDEIIDDAEQENNRLQNDVNNGNFKNSFTRKELLQDIDHIEISEDGSAHLYFKSLNELEKQIEDLFNGLVS